MQVVVAPQAQNVFQKARQVHPSQRASFRQDRMVSENTSSMAWKNRSWRFTPHIIVPVSQEKVLRQAEHWYR